MRSFFLVVQILCLVSGVITAYAQNNTRLPMHEVERQSSYYSRQSARVQQANLYRLQPGFVFTSMSLRIDSSATFEGAYVIHRQDTFYLSADEHTAPDISFRQANLRQANLVIFDQPVEEVLFYPATIRGKVSFAFFNASGEKKSLTKSLRTARPLHPTTNVCEEPAFVPQAEWREGLPTPSYTRTTTSVKHVIVHHSATFNSLTNYENVVRNIYLYHTLERRWSDIGYNYLIAQNGTIFEGRSAGSQSVANDNIQGAHFCSKNSNTMGICLLGNYQTAQPTDTAVASLIKLTGWKLRKETLDPYSESVHSTNAALPTIAGHRDGCATKCPGSNLYVRLNEIRDAVADYLAAGCGDAPIAVAVYPVPVAGTLTVELPDTIRLETIRVYDMAGKQWEAPIAPKSERYGTFSLDTRILATGLYVLYLSGKGWEEHRKILVE